MAEQVPDWAADPATPASDGVPDWAKDSSQSVADKPLNWSDVPMTALKNIPSSGSQFISNMAQPFIHPIATATALKNIGQGALEKTGMLSGDEHVQDLASVGHFLMNRYGSMDALKNTIATDPVGLAGDLSMLLTGGETAAGRVPGIIGEVARASGTVGRIADPVQATLSAAKLAGNVAGKAGAESVGLLTGTGPRALETAAAAGFEGGPAAQAFKENMRGQVPMDKVVDDARSAVQQMRAQRGAEYRAGMANVGLDKSVLDFNDIDSALAKADQVKNYKGQSLSPSTEAIRQTIKDEIDGWRALDPAEFHTAEGFDALKQKIGDIRDATDFGSPERKVANDAYGAIRQSIVNQVPEYAKVMKGYEEASNLTKEIERTLSLPKDNKTGPAIDTSLRKLQSVLRNNVSTNYGNRTELAKYLVNSGAPHLMEALAGQATNTWVPRGLAQLGARLAAEMGAAAIGLGLTPHAALPVAATLPLMSPRLMGEAAYGAGALARPLKNLPMPPFEAGQGAFQLGRLAGQPRPRFVEAPGVANANPNEQPAIGPPNQQHRGGKVQQQERASGGSVHKADNNRKVTKTEAHYRGGNSNRKCAVCTMFERPNGCSAVRGQISPLGLCDMFERKVAHATA